MAPSASNSRTEEDIIPSAHATDTDHGAAVA